MVRRCCVPKCKSKKDTPMHRFPQDVNKAEQWLKTITRTDLIGASRKVLDELRICTVHFPDEMINIYTKRRVLKPDAIPALAINSIIETETVNANAEIINIDINNDDCAMSYSNVSNVNNVSSINNVSNVSNINNISNVSNVNNSNVNNTNVSNVAMENVQCIPNFMPILKKSIDHEKVRYLKNDIRRLKKQVNKKKKLIEKHAREKKKSRTNKWDSITEDLTKSQKIFFDIIKKNLKRAPEGPDVKIKDAIGIINMEKRKEQIIQKRGVKEEKSKL
ncbi:uncharacterized protein PF11_0213-like [Solenopsis invicta]|uniref:uncharacterized protein PF11_0213-like n=1 Tax=Solenopsis invicta TaxID=13686 RepID=UPI00193D07A2|nr:uncharacterized protein PF11_0213-like [Solenopsis invicta]